MKTTRPASHGRTTPRGPTSTGNSPTSSQRLVAVLFTSALTNALIGALISALNVACVSKMMEDNIANASPQNAPGCIQTVNKLTEQCNSASDDTLDGLMSVLPQQRASLGPTCSDPAVQPALHDLDACLAGLEQRKIAQDAEAATRRAEAQGRVPDVKADPDYQSIAEAWKRQNDIVKLQCSDAERRRQVRDSHADESRRECDRLRTRLDEISASLREVLERHGIDPRDARALGL